VTVTTAERCMMGQEDVSGRYSHDEL